VNVDVLTLLVHVSQDKIFEFLSLIY
jgi:hypothetical protein